MIRDAQLLLLVSGIATNISIVLPCKTLQYLAALLQYLISQHQHQFYLHVFMTIFCKAVFVLRWNLISKNLLRNVVQRTERLRIVSVSTGMKVLVLDSLQERYWCIPARDGTR